MRGFVCNLDVFGALLGRLDWMSSLIALVIDAGSSNP